MGRFAKLEIDDNDSAKSRAPEQTWVDLDERQCMVVAEEQYLTGAYEDALLHFSRALRFNRDLPAAWVGQVRCLLASGEYKEALTWTDRALERFAGTPELMACKGLALAHLGDSQGRSYLDSAIEMKSPSAWVWLARGECLLLAKADDNAARCFVKAVELAGDDWHTELRVGIAYNASRRHARARGPLMAAARRAPANPLVAYELGVMHEGLGELPAAAGCFERALTLRRNYPAARRALDRVKVGGAGWLLQRLLQKV
ncbi:MAG: tetratricopeptide repeat protein [Capsulimonadaceae bacterium]